MSYSPKTWQDGDVIRAEDLNKIEQGIASGSGGSSGTAGGVDIVIWRIGNTTRYGFYGDFGSALAKVQQGIPLVAVYYRYEGSGGYFSAWVNQLLGVYYNLDYPNQIDLFLTGGVGFRWTTGGIQYFD